DGLDLTQPTVAHQLAGQPEIWVRALLAPDLKGLAGLLGRLHQGDSLRDSQRERLLAINMLALAQGSDGDECVPVIRDGDKHGINVFALEQLAEIGELRHVLAAEQARRPLAVSLVHVADGNILAGPVLALDIVGELETSTLRTAYAYRAESKYVVRCRLLRLG